MSILEGELAEAIADGLAGAGLLSDVVVTRATATGGPSYSPTLTRTDYPCRGWRDAYTLDERAADPTILTTDIKALIVASTLAIEPRADDRITVKGQTFGIMNASIDAASALWIVQGRA